MPGGIPVDGYTEAWFVPTIADTAAPTVAEINAGIRLGGTLTKDGLSGFKADQAMADTSALTDRVDTEVPGTQSYKPVLKIKKVAGSDTIFDTLALDTQGHIVIRRDIAAATAPTAGQKVEVFPGTAGSEARFDPEKNSVHRYEIPWPVRLPPNTRAVIAA